MESDQNFVLLNFNEILHVTSDSFGQLKQWLKIPIWVESSVSRELSEISQRRNCSGYGHFH